MIMTQNSLCQKQTNGHWGQHAGYFAAKATPIPLFCWLNLRIRPVAGVRMVKTKTWKQFPEFNVGPFELFQKALNYKRRKSSGGRLLSACSHQFRLFRYRIRPLSNTLFK